MCVQWSHNDVIFILADITLARKCTQWKQNGVGVTVSKDASEEQERKYK